MKRNAQRIKIGSGEYLRKNEELVVVAELYGNDERKMIGDDLRWFISFLCFFRMSRGVHRLDVVLVSMLLTSMLAGTRSNSVRCEDARLRCAYRTGCGMALQHYVTGCASVLQGDNCSDACQHALIALTSTDEGKELMTVREYGKKNVFLCLSIIPI